MRSDDIDVLQLLANAATDWRAAALSQGVSLDILTTRINGEIVQLEWDANLVLWNIRTAANTFQLVWVPDETDSSKSKWRVTSN